MKSPLIALALALGLTLGLSAESFDTRAAANFIRKANAWMQSIEDEKRKAAYTSWLQMGPEAMPEYEKSLEASKAFHRQALDDLCAGSRNRANPYAEHARVADDLETERSRVMPLIRTDWKKEPKKVAELRDEIEALTRLHDRAAKTAEADVSDFDQTFRAHLDALVEIHRELERFDAEARSTELDDEALLESVIADHFEAAHLVEQRKIFARSRAHLDDHARASAHNESRGGWCSKPMKEFAAILNGERAVLGLRALRLEENLSAACEGHSEDMARLGFFAHESPVPGKKTPWDRAKLAGFKGRAGGENIYMGSSQPRSAYNGWFASDGHRFIMMGQDPNTLGVGIAGSHWTMMTGNFDFPVAPELSVAR